MLASFARTIENLYLSSFSIGATGKYIFTRIALREFLLTGKILTSLDYFLCLAYTHSVSIQLLSNESAAALRKTLHRHGMVIVQ